MLPPDLDTDLGALLDLLPTGALVHRDGVHTHLNAAGERILRWSLDDIPDAEAAFERWYPDEARRERVRALWAEATAADHPDGEVLLPVRCGDGEDRMIAFAPPQPLGEDTWLVAFMDATRRTRAEEALQGVLATMDGLGTYQLAVDPEAPALGRVRSVSETAARLFGITSDTPLTGWFAHVHPSDLDRVIAAHTRSGTEGVAFDELVRFVRPDGGLRHVHIRSVPQERTDGTQVFFGLAIDCTDREEARAARQRLMLQVEQGSRADAVADLSAEIGHDLRNLLTVAHVLTDEIREGTTDPIAHERLDALERLHHQITAVADHLHRRSLTSAPHVHPVDLPAFARETAELAARALSRPVQVSLRTSLRSIQTDPERLRRAVLNVLLNALQVTEPSGLVTLEVDQRDRQVILAVVDDGPGLPPDQLDRVFERDVSLRPGGTGLGLPSTLRLVRALGGGITLSNRPEGGLRAEITLPVHHPEARVSR